jgi:hypothetical protein
MRLRLRITASILTFAILGVAVYVVYSKKDMAIPHGTSTNRSDVSTNSGTGVGGGSSTTVSSTSETGVESPFTDLDPKLHVSKGVTLAPEVIQVNYELTDVVLCGETYKTKQIFIDGVDVVRRFSTILANDKSKSDWYCGIVEGRARDSGGMLIPGEEIHLTIDGGHPYYFISMHLGTGLINIRSGTPHSWDSGFPIVVMPDKNQIEGTSGYNFGTLK